MKKILLLSVLLGMAWVPASQAVVISWYAETSGLTYSSAQLVYVAGGSWGTYVKVGDLATGDYAIPPSGEGVTEQSATDVARSAGAYYVVLFSDAGGLTAAYHSETSIAYDDANAITLDIWNPATGFFAPSGGSGTGWEPIPEPSTFALLAVGAAVLAWKRRKHG